MSRRSRRLPELVETARIKDLTADGRGVADVEGKSAFVDGAISGELVSFQRTRRRRNYDEARLVDILEPSADRVDPPCDYFLYCGGCALQHVSPAAQVRIKQDSLLQALDRIGKVSPEEVLEPLAGRPLGYRRRARLGVRFVEKKGRVLVGFRERRKSYVADMDYCHTLKPELAELIRPLADLIAKLSIASQVPQIEVSMGDNATSLIFRVLETPNSEDRQQLADFAERSKLQIWLQTGGPETVEPLDTEVAPESLWYELPEYDLRLVFGPLDFIQVNQDMNRRMIVHALQLAKPQPHERVLDLFCGIGNFTLPFARFARQVVGVELDPKMVGKARANAALNKLENVEFHAADLAVSDDEQPNWWGEGFELVVLDPPRAGAQESLPRIAASGASRILYVSCHAGSLARDAGILCDQFGFNLRSAGAMDMFPATSHVEAVALFER